MHQIGVSRDPETTRNPSPLSQCVRTSHTSPIDFLVSHELEIVADHLAVKFLARSPRNSLIRSARTCRSTFDGFGDFILPWSDGIVPAITKPLSLEKLLPWIGDGWDAQTCVDGLNYMIDKINAERHSSTAITLMRKKRRIQAGKIPEWCFSKARRERRLPWYARGGGFMTVAAVQEGFRLRRSNQCLVCSYFLLVYFTRLNITVAYIVGKYHTV